MGKAAVEADLKTYIEAFSIEGILAGAMRSALKERPDSARECIERLIAGGARSLGAPRG